MRRLLIDSPNKYGRSMTIWITEYYDSTGDFAILDVYSGRGHSLGHTDLEFKKYQVVDFCKELLKNTGYKVVKNDEQHFDPSA